MASILLLNFNLTEVFSQVLKSFIKHPPPPALQGLINFISITFGGGGVGLNRPGGIFEMGVLFFLAKDLGFSSSERTSIQSGKPQVREVGDHAAMPKRGGGAC